MVAVCRASLDPKIWLGVEVVELFANTIVLLVSFVDSRFDMMYSQFVKNVKLCI
jgi:hypothetical protein